LTSAWRIQQGLAASPLDETSFGSFRFAAKVGLALGEASWGIMRSRDGKKATYFFRGSVVDDSANAEHQARPGEIYLSADILRVLSEDIVVEHGDSFHKLASILTDLPSSSPVLLPPLDEESSRVFVADNILERDERGEFRQAVNLFMRFPDLPYETLQKTFQIMFDLQKQYGGLLSRLDFGDKGCNTLILWGAPVAYENDIGRALNFLHDLKSRVDFPITSGVTYYIAHAGFLGGDMSEDYTCYGWGVNLASRFMISAPNGETWIDERIARRVKNRFDHDYHGAQKFKGFETEQKVFVLHDRKPQLDSQFQGEFVGREVELPRLVDFLQPLKRGDFAGAMVIWGDAGIGKSRLVYELKVSGALGNQNVLWAFCHSEQILRHSFNPFRYWLFRFFGLLLEMENEEARKRIFDSNLDTLIASTSDPELVDALQRGRFALGALLDLNWAESPFEKLDAEGRYNNTILALIALLKAESLRQPIILFIEDAQFLDEDSRAFLPRLKRALASSDVRYPVAILVSSRRSGVAMLEESLPDVSMELGALSVQALSSLAEIQLGAPPSAELVHLLRERSEGNPYFAEQILTYLQEENLLEMSPSGWRALQRLHESALPADIRSLLMARLDQLSEGVRDAIQTASILGREFEVPLLAIMTPDAPLTEYLADASQAEILMPVGSGRYAFTHGLLRDAAYSMQMSARRAELHAHALTALERIHAADLEARSGELAHHAEQADLTDKALHYLPLAGRRASGLYQNAQAIDYFSRALNLLPSAETRARFELILDRVEVYRRTGNRKAQLQDVDTLEQLARQMGGDLHLAKARYQYANYCYSTGDYPSSMESALDAIRLSAEHDLSATLDSYLLLVFSLMRQGKLDAGMQKAREGLVLARREKIEKHQATILNGMGLISIEQNDIPQGMKYLAEAIGIARTIADESVETTALNNLGNTAGLLGDYSMARDCYERVYMSCHHRGDRYGESFAYGNLGWAAGMQGDFSASRSYHQQSLKIAREVGNRYQEAYTLINLSGVLAVQGDSVAALECARMGREICQAIGERSGEAWAFLNMGHAYLLAEEMEEAQLMYERCLAIREELRQSNLAAEALAGLLHIALVYDDALLLERWLNPLLETMNMDQEFAGAEDPIRIYFNIHRALEKTKDPRRRIVLENANQLLAAQVSKFKTENERLAYLDNVPWRRALWDAIQKKLV